MCRFVYSIDCFIRVAKTYNMMRTSVERTSDAHWGRRQGGRS